MHVPDTAVPGLTTSSTRGEVNETIKAFAVAPQFRAATVDELINEANPFRRPVRPDDLSFLDYSSALTADEVGSLSALLGHRMLLNAYEAELVFLPDVSSLASTADAQAFYSSDGRLRAERARPILERHLFSYLAEAEPAAPAPVGPLVDHMLSERDRLAANDFVGCAIRSLARPREAMLFVLLQLSATLPTRMAAIGRGALGDDSGQVDVTGAFLAAFQQERERLSQLRELLSACGLTPAPRAYWQFYLGSTMATVTYLHGVCRDHSRLFEATGALLHHTVAQPVLDQQYQALSQATLGFTPRLFAGAAPTAAESRAQIEALVLPLLECYGEDFAVGCRRGFDASARLASLAADDLVAQVTWADQLERYKAKAEGLRRLIRDEEIEIDLDTFVESWEVTSTTHVHDDHRLVVIEEGEMHFWNNIGEKIRLSTGDAVLIPKGRLHGSTVLSGECTYHQPIIPDELLERVK